MNIGLLTQSKAYRPFRFEWAYLAWLRQQQIHWIPEEVDMGEDIKDWGILSTEDKSFLTSIFRFFTQADIDVSHSYLNFYLSYFKPNEVRMMLTSFANAETIHISAYALLIETLGMPDSEFLEFLKYKPMVDKHNYLAKCNMNNYEEVLKTLAIYGAFTEGLQLFGSFAMLLNYNRFGLMKGMGQLVAWSVRDESLHCESIIKLFHTFAKETGALTKSVKETIIGECEQMVSLEDDFIELVFNNTKPMELDIADVKSYIRFVANQRLDQLGLHTIYSVTKHPLPWLKVILSGVEHSNFFEGTATDYTNGATAGTWANAWCSL